MDFAFFFFQHYLHSYFNLVFLVENRLSQSHSIFRGNYLLLEKNIQILVYAFEPPFDS